MSKALWMVLGTSLLATPVLAAPGGYAEGVYADYAAATGDAVTFTLTPLQAGSMESLRGRKLMDLTGAPRHTLVVEERALSLEGARWATADLKELYLDDLDSSLETFEAVGFPLSKGQYRLFKVSARLDKQVREQLAVEFCWTEQGHCVVFDPSIDFLNSVVANLRQTRASGWAPLYELEPVQGLDLLGARQQKARHCGLADFPNSTAAQITWGARRLVYRNLYNFVMVTKDIGGARAGVRCDASCRPQPYGYTNASSAFANIPFSVQCDYAHAQGTSGSRAKYVGKTGCAHRAVLGAKFNATARGVGIGVEVDINSTGSVDQNGGAYLTSCAWFN